MTDKITASLKVLNKVYEHLSSRLKVKDVNGRTSSIKKIHVFTFSGQWNATGWKQSIVFVAPFVSEFVKSLSFLTEWQKVKCLSIGCFYFTHKGKFVYSILIEILFLVIKYNRTSSSAVVLFWKH